MGKNSFSQFMTGISLFALLLGGLALDAGSAIAVETDAGVEIETGDSVLSEKPETAAEAEDPNRITRKGLTIEFDLKPVLGSFEEERDLLDHDYANAVFRITDATTGQPVKGLIPGAWMDIRKTAKGETTEALSCKDRVGLYLRGSTGARPMIDLNSYFILVLNEDATITVVDPSVLIAGVGDMFFTQVILKRPGADWVQTRDQRRIFVSMPRANAVAVVDTETFKLVKHVKTGKEPFRVALQGDEKYLWVGNNAKGKDGGGITVIDVETMKVAATIETGRGHHEIAFSDDDRYALVTNRNDGTASLIDIQSLKKIEDIEIGAAPISVSYSKLSKAFYVADGETGVVSVVDAAKRQITARIAAKPGLGPMSITGDGRWVLVTNSAADLVHVIDTATNAIAHDVAIPGKPFKISLTRAFAYVRALESERVSMINLAMLGETGKPPVVTFPAGAKPPSAASSLGVADSIVEAAGEAGVVLISPAENTLYYYMEGMNAPIGNFRSYGHNPRAVMVTDRSLDEREPGVYSAKIQIPVAGTYDVAFILDSPRILHCFSVEAKENPLLKKDLKPLEVEYLVEEKRVAAGQTVPLRFRLIDPATEQPRSGLKDVRVLSYRSPGRSRTVTSAKEVGDGIYEADLAFPRHGAYFIYVSSRSSKVPFGELPYLTMRAFRDKASLEKALSAKGTGG